MTRQTKIILGVVGAVVVLCLGICVVGGLFVNRMGKNVQADLKPNPEKAAQAASEIADLTPPPGFQANTSVKFLGYTFVIYENSQSQANTLILMQMPVRQEINDTTIEQMKQAMERQSGRRMNNVQMLETRSLTIRDHPAMLVVQEGTYGENEITIRQLMVYFQGKDGLAMLMVSMPSAEWDQAAFDAMVKSIK
jgi:hypothetical protein